MPMWGSCRYCGEPTEPGFLDCPACELDIEESASARDALRAAVARWAMSVEKVRGKTPYQVRPKEEYL
jgi:hypothetical protein